jgi:hypothetical protein
VAAAGNEQDARRLLGGHRRRVIRPDRADHHKQREDEQDARRPHKSAGTDRDCSAMMCASVHKTSASSGIGFSGSVPGMASASKLTRIIARRLIGSRRDA